MLATLIRRTPKFVRCPGKSPWNTGGLPEV